MVDGSANELWSPLLFGSGGIAGVGLLRARETEVIAAAVKRKIKRDELAVVGAGGGDLDSGLELVQSVSVHSSVRVRIYSETLLQ